MSELSGLEWRRAALEASDWKFYTDENQPFNLLIVRPGSPLESYAVKLKKAAVFDDLQQLSFEKDAPAVESDPAVSEPWFLEWCERNGWCWELRTCAVVTGERFVCRLYEDDEGDGMSDITAYGHSPSEARARAVVAAKVSVSTSLFGSCSSSIKPENQPVDSKR